MKMVNFETILSLPNLKYTEIDIQDHRIVFSAKSIHKKARCPHCGKTSHSVHSRYNRLLSDLPISDRPVSVKLEVRKFFCKNKRCQYSIFSEQPSIGIPKYSRMTERAKTRILSILKETSAQKGSLISNSILTPISSSSALRLIYSLALPDTHLSTDIVHLGVDDWAMRKGVSYGTILINMDNGKVIDLLPERNGTSLRSWLEKHRNIEIVCRDRASAYAKAVNDVIPDAQQVADRFHLFKNLSDTVFEVILDEHPSIARSLNKNSKVILSQKFMKKNHSLETPRNPQRVEQFKRVKKLNCQGIGKNAIARIVGLNYRTVNRYIDLDELPGIQRSTMIDFQEHLPLILKEISNGKPLVQIHEKLVSMGVECCFKTFWSKFIHYSRTVKGEKNIGKKDMEEVKSNFSLLSAKRLAIYLSYNDIESIPITNHRKQVKQLLEESSLIQDLRYAIVSFREIMKSKDSQRFDIWLDTVFNLGYKKLKSLINGIRMDLKSVHNAITLDYNSGMVEGCVNRLKNIKRQMYGRASFELLKRKVILSCTG